MSKKHFKLIAAAVKAVLDSGADRRVVKDLAYELACVCASVNSRFRRSTFMEACGLDS